MKIIYDEETDIKEELLPVLKKAGELCICREGLDPGLCEISLSIVEPEEIRSINRQFRDKDAVTDVLSFPQYDDLNAIENEEEICLGDVVICHQVALQQAEEYGHSIEREIAFLTAHSMLHLMGYDHMEDEERECMEEKQERILQGLGITRD